MQCLIKSSRRPRYSYTLISLYFLYPIHVKPLRTGAAELQPVTQNRLADSNVRSLISEPRHSETQLPLNQRFLADKTVDFWMAYAGA